MVAVLRTPGAVSLFAASCLARLPMGALALLLVLDTQHRTDSYAKGGLVAGVYALALSISHPALARLIDRRGQTWVLRAGAVVTAAAVVVLALLPADAALGIIVCCAALAGLSQPPVGACMRTLWPALLRRDDERHAAYAIESVALEVVYIFGPLALVAGVGAWSTRLALMCCAAFTLVGDIAFSAHPLSRAWRPRVRRRRRRYVGALGDSGVRVLVAVFALCGLAAGAVEVAVPADLDGMGRRELTGVLLALWGVGSMLAGFAVGRIGAPAEPAQRLALAVIGWGVAHAALSLAGAPLSLALLLFLAGATIAPTIVYANDMLDVLASPGTLTEAVTWMATGISVGMAGGSSLAGVLVEAASPGVAMAVLSVGGLIAALVIRLTAAGPLRSHPVGTAEPASA